MEPNEKEIESERRAAREMRTAILTITLACVLTVVAIALVIVIGHIKLF